MAGSTPRRRASVERSTRETSVGLTIDLDGTGKVSIDTGMGFFDHMLELFAGHGGFDLTVTARGDLQTGGHHTVEDVGICLGRALNEALGDKHGINRYGSVHVPMDEALALVGLDLSGRPFLAYETGLSNTNIAGFDTDLVLEFLRAMVNNAGITAHIRVLAGLDAHHIIEAVFKALGRALGEAVTLNPRVTGVPSTKGVL